MSVQQPFLFSGMFLLKLAGHVPDVTKLSIDFNWLIIFVLFFAIKATMHETSVGILIVFPVISLSRKGTLVCVWKNLSSFDLIPQFMRRD